MDRSNDTVSFAELEASNWQLAAARDQSALRIAIAQNVASNGRLFCCLLAAANYATGVHPLTIALLSAPVGLAWASDLVKSAEIKNGLAVASIASAIFLAIATVLNCW